jgi:LPS-assembly lipoprotein
MTNPHPTPFVSSEVETPELCGTASRLRSRRTVLLVLLGALALSACGLQPLYSGGSQGQVATMLGAVTVDPIEGKNGWLMRNALNDRLAAGGNGEARYKLTVKLDDQIEGFGVRADDTVTRERRTLRARYQLVDLQTGKMVLDATAGSDAGIDVVSSEYATIAGENTALENLTQEVAEQIVTRISLYAQSVK